jgi:hypothetical protein
VAPGPVMTLLLETAMVWFIHDSNLLKLLPLHLASVCYSLFKKRNSLKKITFKSIAFVCYSLKKNQKTTLNEKLLRVVS